MSFELCLKCQHNKQWVNVSGTCQKPDDLHLESVCGHACVEWMAFSPEAATAPSPDDEETAALTTSRAVLIKAIEVKRDEWERQSKDSLGRLANYPYVERTVAANEIIAALRKEPTK